MPKQVCDEDHSDKEDEIHSKVREHRQRDIERGDDLSDDGIVDKVDGKRTFTGCTQGVHERVVCREVIGNQPSTNHNFTISTGPGTGVPGIAGENSEKLGSRIAVLYPNPAQRTGVRRRIAAMMIQRFRSGRPR